MRLNILKRISNKFNRFVDGQFNKYRGQISNEIARILAIVIVFIVIWTMALLLFVLAGIATGLLITKLTGSAIWGFSLVAAVLFIVVMIMGLFVKSLIRKGEEFIKEISAKNATIVNEEILKEKIIKEAKKI